MATHSVSPEQRFWAKVDRSGGPDACWPWMASKDPSGYGKFGITHGKTVNAHRYALTLELGRDPDGLATHSCDNRECCNPRHLSEGTHSSNRQECVDRGRSGVVPSKLSMNQIREIRRLYQMGKSCRSIAPAFGVAHTTVARILRNASPAYLERREA